MSSYYRSFNFFVHQVDVQDIGPRLPFFLKFLKGKKVLHVGCADWPIFNPDKNLHIDLAKAGIEVHGLDLDQEGVNNLKKYVDDKYYTSFDQIDESYDVVLAPEVIEHTLNPGLFMKSLLEVDCRAIIVTGPNAIGHIQGNVKFGLKKVEGEEMFLESVHPDHNCYYSPITLANTVLKSAVEYSEEEWALLSLFTTEGQGMVGCIIGKE